MIILSAILFIVGVIPIIKSIEKGWEDIPMALYTPSTCIFLCTSFILLGISFVIKAINNKIEKTDLVKIETKLRDIADCASKTSSSVDKLVKDKKEEQKSESEKNFDNYETVKRNGRTFVQLDGNLCCPKCHSFVDSELKTMCSNCGKSFME